MRKTTILRQMMTGKRIVVAPGAHDALTAKIIEQVGFEAVYMTVSGQAALVRVSFACLRCIYCVRLNMQLRLYILFIKANSGRVGLSSEFFFFLLGC